MATQYYAYQDDGGTTYPVALSDAQQAMYTAMIGALPTAYATAAALLAAISGSMAFPSGLASRYINLTSAFFGTAPLVVLTATAFNAKFPTGATPFPETGTIVTESVAIAGAVGEQRLSN